MSFKTLDRPTSWLRTALEVEKGKVDLQRNPEMVRWFDMLAAILDRVAPMINQDSFYIELDQLSVYANNAAAIADGKTAGNLYRDGGDPDHVCIVH